MATVSEAGAGMAADAAARVARQTGAPTAAVYISDRRGGQVLLGAHRRSTTRDGEQLPSRMWWRGPAGWTWGGDGHYRVTPWDRPGCSGVVSVGPWPEPELARRDLRRIERAVMAAVEPLVTGLREAEEREFADVAGMERAALAVGRAIDHTNGVLLEAARIELGADRVQWDGTHLGVLGGKPANPRVVAVLESWLAARPPTADPVMHRQITAFALADMLDARSADTQSHSQQAANLAVIAGAAVGLTVAQLETLETVARLQNVGMCFLGTEALRQARIEASEMHAIQRHPVLGAALLAGSGFGPSVVIGVRHHHERWDGEGYPDHLRGDEAPIEARIVGCADAYVALTNPRPWRPALGAAEAAEHMRRGSGRQFDPVAVEAILAARESRLLAEEVVFDLRQAG